MTESDCKNIIKVEEEIEGEQAQSKNYRFSKIGDGISIDSDADFKFDIESLPSCPLAVSERFGVIFVAHSSGFCVARIKDVMEELKKGGTTSCIQALSVVDVSLGKVSLLALSADSSMLAACVGLNLYFFTVGGLLNKDCEPSFSKSLNGSSTIKDMQWSPHLVDQYVVFTRDGSLHHGAGQDDLSNLMNMVDAVCWSMNGKFLAVAKNGHLSILSSKFEEKLRIKLLFDSLIDDDPDCAVKVDSVRWVRPDCIMLGYYCLTADGKEENYLLQLISVKDGKITKPSSSPVAVAFRDVFLAINDDDVPSGSGPYTFVSYLKEFEVAFVANKKNTSQHIVLFAWLPDKENGVEAIDFEIDTWYPTINLQDNSDENLILGLAVNKAYKDETVKLVCGDIDTEVSSCCILLCLTVDGKLFMFHFASATGPSVLPEDLDSVSDEEDSPSLTSKHPVMNIVNDKKQNGDQDLHALQTQKVHGIEPFEKVFSPLSKVGTQPDVPVLNPIDSRDEGKASFKAFEPVFPVNQVGAAVKPSSDAVSKSASDKSNKLLSGVSTELSGNKSSFGLHGLSGSLSSSGSTFSTNVFGAQSSSSLGSFSSGGIFSSNTFDVKPLQSPNAAVQENRPDSSVGTTHISSGLQKFSFPKMSSGSPTLSKLIPQEASTGVAVTKSLAVSNSQASVGKYSDIKFSNKRDPRSQTPSRPFNLERNLSEQRSVEEMAKELDALLYSIEEPGGFYDSSVAAHKPFVAELEEGIWLLSDRCQKWTDSMNRGIEEVQLLLDKTVQVLTRKIYMEAIVKQATDSQYLDIWNRQKLSSELDMKRRHILEINQNLTNQLIELERHLNTLDLQRFGDKGDVHTHRKSFSSKHGPSRHIQSLHSLHNTMNAQLTAAEKLSECLYKQMAVLSIETEPVKKQNIKKELFDTIGISYDDTTFSSPGQEKAPKSSLSISSSAAAANTRLNKSPQGAVKSFEPETARRRRDSLDKNWATNVPPKTTVKRMFLKEDHQPSPARLSVPFTVHQSKQKVGHRLFERPGVSHDIPQITSNMSQIRGSQDLQLKQHSEGQSSSLWGGNRSDSFGSGSQSMPTVTQDAARDYHDSTAEKPRNRFTFTLKPEPVVVNDSKSDKQSQDLREPSSNITTNIFQKKPIEYLESSGKKADGNQRPTMTESSSIWSKKSIESPFSAVSSATSSTAFSGKSFSLEASTRESQSSSASFTVPVTKTTSPFMFKDAVSSSESDMSLGKSSTGFGFNLGTTKNAPISGPSPSSSSFSSTTSLIKPTLNIDLNTSKTELSILKPDTSESNKSDVVSAPKFDLKANEKSTGQVSPPMPVVSVSSGPSSQPSTSSFSGNQVNLTSTSSPALLSSSKREEPSVSLSVSSPSISSPLDGVGGQINGSDLVVTQEDEMDEEAPETAQLTLGNFGGFGLGSSNASAPKQNPFGAPFGDLPTSTPNTPITSFSASPPTVGLFRPASFTVESQQPSQPPQQTSFGAFAGGFGSNNNQSSGGQGFGQPARIGSGQQALGSVLGSFGQSRQFGAGLPGSVASPSPFGSAFGGNQTSSGFATAASGGSGFANLASGGGGFGGLAAGGGGGFAAAATGGGGFASAATGGGGFASAATGSGGFAAAAATGTGGFGNIQAVGGFGAAPAAGGGFGAAPAAGGGFGAAPAAGGGFGAAPAAGGGFGAAPAAGGGFGAAPVVGGGFAGAASGGFGGFSSQGGSGFSTFGSSGGTVRPSSELFTQMRK
uniref:nuclear pore complex protein NUP214 isoform X2 n=1 Tax=Erigeron canadensis TaxID=72917 RepID=UPI001CB97DF4|nr:nuclear pore complex protein NUP214 isoform X2 [Erigeron canadensis]